MEISIIVARGANNEIGEAGKLPWQLPRDLAHFRQITMGHAVIMGRHTMNSIPKIPLSGRLNIVVSNKLEEAPEGVVVCRSLREAISFARHARKEKACIIGGAQIYEEALPIATELFLTEVLGTFPQADTFLPTLDETQWQLVSQELEEPADEQNAYATRFCYFKKHV